ncbi:GapA-binding peptide SR1P [Paenibacillus paridis]|uniref:GapA-binding peptide SR1P n=1 Tax=Paenibacillus paridis TaxID=2583376 RepID=UPI001EE47C6B|nr:GapA-binding peptide SR1P [Paenibacillus paridis]
MEYQSVEMNGSNKKKDGLELGYVICKRCDSLIATLPTNRVKRFYGECSEGCKSEIEGAREFD